MSDRAVAGALVRIQKAKRSSRIMKRARGMGLMSHPASKYGVRYVPSGSAEGIDAYGADFRSATEAQRMKRRADGYYGRGEYWGKAIGGLVGQMTGVPGGGAFLGHVGDKIGDWFKRRFRGRGLYEGRGGSGTASTYSGGGLYEGRGAYSNVHAAAATDNSLILGGQPGMKFSGMHDETSGLTVSHTEFVSDVFAPSNSAFSVNAYPLNPGLQEIFPQLSQIALNFEEYEFIQLIFHYRSTVDSSSTNNASGNTGTIILATDYGSAVQNFKEKSQMVASHGAVAERITMPVNHGVECDPSKNMGSAQKTVRNSLIRDRDVSTLDLGKFQIAFQNTPSAFFNQQVGELWVTYTVHLDKPRLYSALSGNVSQFQAVSKGGEALLTPMGTNILTALNNSLSMAISNASLGGGVTGAVDLIFPAAVNGSFEVRVQLEGTGLTTADLYSLFGNVTLRADQYGTDFGTAGDDGANAIVRSISGTQIIKILRVDVRAASGGVNNRMTIGMTTTGTTTITQCYVSVIEVNPFNAQSGVNPAPIFVDSLGVVTIP